MSGSALLSSPSRGRHQLQVSRSITERLPGSSSRHPHAHTHTSHHHDHHLTRHIPSPLHRRDRSRDGRGGGGGGGGSGGAGAGAGNGAAAVVIGAAGAAGAAAQPSSSSAAAAAMAAQVAARGSFEVSRHEGASPANPSPAQSRAGSVLVSSGAETPGVVVGPGAGAGAGAGVVPLSREEELRRESEKAEARAAGLKKSLLDLAAFSTATNRRLDETYYIVLQKLTALQNTILALQDLARASTSTNAGFIAESRGVVAEAQAQLDAFGDFTAPQARVEALQARVQGGRRRIAALSGRVDVVRRRVERWERADREWQERTRRRLKIVWGVALGVGVVLLLLYGGVRAYAPEVRVEVTVAEGVAGLPARVTEAAAAGLRRPGKGGADGDGAGRNGSAPALDLDRERKADAAGDEALRALDEL